MGAQPTTYGTCTDKSGCSIFYSAYDRTSSVSCDAAWDYLLLWANVNCPNICGGDKTFCGILQKNGCDEPPPGFPGDKTAHAWCCCKDN